MQVSLTQFKAMLTKAKHAVSSGPIDGATEYILIEATKKDLNIGGRGVALSYVGKVPYSGKADFKSVYIPMSSVNALLLNKTKNDVLNLSFDGTDLHFSSDEATGFIQPVEGLRYADPYRQVTGEEYLVLNNGIFLAEAIDLTAQVKRGWTVATQPYPAGFVRLAVYKEEEDSADPMVCRLLLDSTTFDQEKALQYLSDTALSVFSSDETRYYQMFEPVYVRKVGSVLAQAPISELMNPTMVGVAVHLYLKDAVALSKVLSEETYLIHLILDEKYRPEAMILFNSESFIWVRCALDMYPDLDFNRQLSLMRGEEIALFYPTPAFISSVKAAIQIKSTKEHGLTIRVSDGKIFVTSPEHGSTVRYSEVEADTYSELTAVVSGNGFLSAIDTKDHLLIVAGSDFTAIYNTAKRSRVVLRNFTRT